MRLVPSYTRPEAVQPAPEPVTPPRPAPRPAAEPAPAPEEPVAAVTPEPAFMTALDEAMAVAPAPRATLSPEDTPPSPPAPTQQERPRPEAPEEEEQPPLPEPREDDLVEPDFEQLDEDYDRLAMEAQDEEDMLGLESEEHEPLEATRGRYEVFSLQDSGMAQHISILTPDAEEESSGEASEGLPLPSIDLQAHGRQHTWSAIVAHLRLFHAPLAATLEHAYVEEFTPRKISITYVQRYSHFVNDEKRLSIIKDLLKELFGDSFEMVIGTRFEDIALPGFETLAQLRDAALRARRDQLADDTEHHPVVRQAHELFSPTASRIMVALHED